MNFIIYEDDRITREKYKNVIHNFMGCKETLYHIHEFDCFDKKGLRKINREITGKKIYLLDVEVPGMSGLEVARLLRSSGDWISQIIVITTHKEYNTFGFTNKLLMLNFIYKDSNIVKELYSSLESAFDILRHQDSISFKCDSEIVQVMYRDIYYIEKNLNGNDSKIVTKDKDYIIKYSINKLMEIFDGDPRFFKSHRSCIVNINNIISFDIDSNTINFKNKTIDLVARDKKKILKEKLLNRNKLFSKNH